MTRQETSQCEAAAEGGIDQLITTEVKIVGNRRKRSMKLLIFVLLCLIVAGYSSYYVNKSATPRADVELAGQVQRYPIPERLQVALTTEDVAVSGRESLDVVVLADQRLSLGNAVSQQDPVAVPLQDVIQPAAVDFRVVIGPFIRSSALVRAEELLKRQGWNYENQVGDGEVEMIRLLDGNYTVEVAHARLGELQKTYESAFVLPAGDGLDVYLASFYDSDRAVEMAEELQLDGYRVTLVRSRVQMQRTLLLSEYMIADNARRLLDLLQSEGIHAEMTEKR
jgi:hypothetical protein